MYCPDCGSEISDDAAFCPECGIDVDAELGRDRDPAETSEPRTESTSQQPVAESTQQPTSGQQPEPQAPQQQPPRNPQTQEWGVGSWAPTRMATVGAGLVAGLSLFLPWVTAIQGEFSANGMATEFGTFVMLGAAVSVIGASANWGRGWGRLSMLLTGLAGVGIASIAYLIRAILSETYTYGTIIIDGRRLPIAALEPASGVQIALLTGAVVAVASLGGLLGSFTSN